MKPGNRKTWNSKLISSSGAMVFKNKNSWKVWNILNMSLISIIHANWNPCNFAIQNSKHLQISKYATQQPIQHPKCNPPTWNITIFPTEPRKPPKNRASRGTHRFFVTIFTLPGSKYGDQTSVKETHRLCVHGLHYPALFRLWWSVAYFMMSQEVRQTMGTP